MIFRFLAGMLLIGSVLFFAGCQGLVKGVSQLTVNVSGPGTGLVTSTPAGISCPGTCSANFQGNATVVLTAAPNTGFGFGGWTGSCTGTSSTCTVTLGGSNVTADFTATLQSINHIIFMAQENRSFDSYFGAMRQYWAQNNIPDQAFNGLPQFNPAGDPNAGPAPTNPGCDPAFPYDPITNANPYCQIDPASPPVTSFHFQSTCVENPSPSWAESHHDWNVHNPTDPQPLLDGFVDSGANDARQHIDNHGVFAPYFDTDGIRAMGYYDGTDLNYYYALASDFAMSDAWFAPVMSRTPPNRQYMIAGTSHGHAYPLSTTNSPPIPDPPIFEKLEQANISWKIYVDPGGTPVCQSTDILCLLGRSYIHDFAYGKQIAQNIGNYTNNPMHSIAPISEFYTDAANGQLPQVAQIEPASNLGLDEHPSDDDPAPGQPACCSMQGGANYVSMLINAVMCGQTNSPPSGTCTAGASWKDSVFVLLFDEPGGFYDHVAPQLTVSPDGIQPSDLFSNDPCFGATTPGTVCDFSYTGFRVPMVVISPFARKNFVSHQVRDSTAILKLIETRFNLSALTKRDAAQVGMDDPTTGFFDFTTGTWTTPPVLPVQNNYGPSACFVNPPPTSP